MNMLCSSNIAVGLLGFCFFVGVVLSLIFVPPLSEAMGKKTIFCISVMISVFAQAGLIWLAESLNEALILISIIGVSWPGKRIIGLAYILDFYPETYKNTRILWFNLFDYPSILLMSICYQHFDRNWYNQQLTGLILSIICLVYCYLLMPESPKYMYLRMRFDELRDTLEYMMRLNGDREKLNIILDSEEKMRKGETVFRVY
jgi:MFS family permease